MAATGTDTRNQPPEERTEQKPEPQENSDPDSRPATGTAKLEAAAREKEREEGPLSYLNYPRNPLLLRR